MKKIFLLTLVLIFILCSCGKKEEDDGFDLLTIPEGTPLSLMNSFTYDVIPYSRDNADIEALIEKINALGVEDVTAVDFVDYKDDTPFVTVYVERETTYIFRTWSFGEGECAAMLYMVGSSQNIYAVTFNDTDIASLIESIYKSFEG